MSPRGEFVFVEPAKTSRHRRLLPKCADRTEATTVGRGGAWPRWQPAPTHGTIMNRSSASPEGRHDHAMIRRRRPCVPVADARSSGSCMDGRRCSGSVARPRQIASTTARGRDGGPACSASVRSERLETEATAAPSGAAVARLEHLGRPRSASRRASIIPRSWCRRARARTDATGGWCPCSRPYIRPR